MDRCNKKYSLINKINTYSIIVLLTVVALSCYSQSKKHPNEAKADVKIKVSNNTRIEHKQIQQTKATLVKQTQIKKKSNGGREAKRKTDAGKPKSKPYLYKLNMQITGYTNGKSETGKSPGEKGYGITASGVRARVNDTIAMHNDFPFGTQVKIEGYGNTVFTVRDRGKFPKNVVDMFVKDMKEVNKFGRKKRTIYILKWGNGK